MSSSVVLRSITAGMQVSSVKRFKSCSSIVDYILSPYDHQDLMASIMNLITGDGERPCRGLNLSVLISSYGAALTWNIQALNNILQNLVIPAFLTAMKFP